ncbi:DinB family protein [Brevibacillus fluminis]|uniref:DinB family protein n=1 Tax=Brevibacillus fluminis TaxID=511487 RepID=A0A3M8CX95_9BACL|nr:DinB family protein [Brevibacillus fluminis]RNB80248.1 DinB family protein [Brevibacillus fluminis]
MSQTQQARNDIFQLIDDIVQVVQPLTETELHWKATDDVWSVMEILCHVEEIIPYWLLEIQSVLQSPQSEWGRNHLHEGRLTAVAKAKQRTKADILQGIEGTKNVVHAIMGALTDEALAIEAPSRNPRWGTKTMSFVLNHLVVEHLQSHLGQINRTVASANAINPNQ